MSTGWSIYIIAIVALNIVGCVWLLWWTGKRRPGDPAPTDTSHVWDGDLTEYNKPMPRWWINLFYITIVFGIGYLVLYPGLGAFAGTSGWTSARQHDAERDAREATLATTFAPYGGQPIDTIAQDPHALELGRSIFANHCATCHGSSARGARGYPDLTDTSWQWGGDPDTVLATVLDGREGIMAPWEQVLGGPRGVTEVAVYVQSLSGTATDPALARAGKTRFDGICVACHGRDAKGNPALGAPDLTDRVWLYGGDYESIRTSISQGRHGVMPAHRGILGETRARVVAAYVWSLSNTPKQPVAASP
ncbi:cytochrome-c oxidase, cbb3-type subunit III [Chiayiivirga flava]|uniref:Cbb3-type cytochrome c oxidase subunit n=1 Tax=Chiayiivirga flava TaxID=659595 RepID=A0A7W8D388_9GAMM|nr:cytochrome-c oxidase, cbb3-type subunit III [Chiayiivirga flava]MBB5207116.1 cytochrome c oxidase cbb3-type subunit 3 [Chiayiivirga flava]